MNWKKAKSVYKQIWLFMYVNSKLTRSALLN